MLDSSNVIEEKINVFCRLKPINQSQNELQSSCIKSCPEDGTCKYIKRSHDENEIPQEILFPIRCFEQNHQQEEIFTDVAKPICDSVIRGYNGTIMAYGPTNSGKTYTMRGNDSSQELGIIPRCMQYILSKVHSDTIVMVSYLQIYCETITDLLDPNYNGMSDSYTTASASYSSSSSGNNISSNNNNNNSSSSSVSSNSNSNSSSSNSTNSLTSSPLQLREAMGRVYVEGLSSFVVHNVHDLQSILSKGDERRKTSSTNANMTSSRSHAILIIKVCQQNNDNDDNSNNNNNNNILNLNPNNKEKIITKHPSSSSSQQSSLVLCDLAGSERATASTGLNYMRLEEAKAINLSLSVLGNCMNALAERKLHIPYRDSKLTRILSNSLGGDSRTSIIVTVIPEEDKKGEYLNTLRFASRASKVKVIANLVRYVDYEKLYNTVQKQLDEWEEEKRKREVVIDEMRDRMEIKEEEMGLIQNEVRVLKSQLLLYSSMSSSNNSSNNISSSNSSSNSSSGISGSSSNNNSNSSNIDTINTSNNTAINNNDDTPSTTPTPTTCNNPHCDIIRHQLLQQHTLEIESFHHTHHSSLQREKAVNHELEQEIYELQLQLKQERQNHLSTVLDLKKMNELKDQSELECQIRIQEMYSEIDNKNLLIEENKEMIIQLQQQQQQQQQPQEQMTGTKNHSSSSSSSSSSLQDGDKTTMKNKKNNHNDNDDDDAMISKSKMHEMEALFMMTVEKLSDRLHQLEMTTNSNGNSSNSNGRSNNNNNSNRQQQQFQQLQSNSSSGSRNNKLPSSSSSSKHPLKKALDYSNGR